MTEVEEPTSLHLERIKRLREQNPIPIISILDLLIDIVSRQAHYIDTLQTLVVYGALEREMADLKSGRRTKDE